MSNSIKHILVIRLSAMGDVAMTVPVLRAFVKQYPGVNLTVLTRAFYKPFFKDLPNVEVFVADVKGVHKGVVGLFRLSKTLKKQGVDAVADLHNVLRSKILKGFMGNMPFFQIDKGREEKKDLTKGRIFKQLKTTHQRYADVFGKLGFPIDLSAPVFPEKANLSSEAKKLLGHKNSKWIGIAPFAAFSSKMYPLELMRKVVEKLSENHLIVLFGGGQAETKLLDEFSSSKSNIVNLAGKLSFEDELDVISNLDVMISMDSGNGHIAAMYGVKVVTIWGVTHPHAGFVPFNQPDSLQLTADRKEYPLVPTSIYGNKYPEHYLTAAGSIKPETVIEKITAVLEES
ncbi:glycosyltransferase family 9 protein [Mangrovimonas aestuarii]|uniref:glycosyltransferase family 9 protein n=1 Tax=Mangrovimonas aestuarii TaxID=3018443 RepID=UPI0023788C77|nr:glycosyltransferase family 9 protein [Mangrovimonas aestuarii]